MIINDRLEVAAQQSADGKQYQLVNNKHVPWGTSATFLDRVPKTRRHQGQTCWCMFESEAWQYQFQGGVEDENLVRLGGTIKGEIPSPGGVILLPAGRFYREILLTGTGNVSIGTTEGGTEKLDDANISGVNPYIGYLNIKPVETTTIYVTCANDVSYEIFKG